MLLQAAELSDDMVLHNMYVAVSVRSCRLRSPRHVAAVSFLVVVFKSRRCVFVCVSRAMLRSELVRLLQKLAESHSSKKERTVFVINNVNLIISVLHEVCVPHVSMRLRARIAHAFRWLRCLVQRHVSASDIEIYEDLLTRQTAVFVEEELAGFFQPLINFVRATEAEVEQLCG
jgi:hypothetical protein